ncbi:hypothetical protein GGX14DRAFT_587219 [Mycena pura]|uniref:CxC2-like cysteine cluster KDZ transposase-associated domain-containing protein n=1 Tax=Mycena pura TaxID=153505 RepID=A0AAD6USM7_9AGAR|nr:hypothetical protein GGX14DRAFT_587219 [Mycena pura]
MTWAHALRDDKLTGRFRHPDGTRIQSTHPILVVDLFGLFPCTPGVASVAITTRELEVFRRMQLRCQRLGIQAWVRGLCDIHGVLPRPYLGAQFSIAFDFYLAVLEDVEQQVQAALGRDTPNWRLRNACPCCMYKLEGEPELERPFLATMDGNNSLKRIQRRTAEGYDEEGNERIDRRVPAGDYYIPRAEVDSWAIGDGEEHAKAHTTGDEEVPGDGGKCTERWHNMNETETSKAWGIYDETGIFVALCRHGFILKIVDMIKSGELMKYGYAVLTDLVQVLEDIATTMGYDIGCEFDKLVKKHPRLGLLAQKAKFQSTIGAFHGAGHNRRCQARNLPKYTPGVGLEGFELCETFFSKSNAVAGRTRYLSVFHRLQAITTFLRHSDRAETSYTLSQNLVTKYKRALEILDGEASLKESMSIFDGWLRAEREYLESLEKEPEEETLQMEYYQKLVNYYANEAKAAELRRDAFVQVEPGDSITDAAKATRQQEAWRRHTFELAEKSLEAVMYLESRMGIATRWVPGTRLQLDSKRRYQRALDTLEKLVVSRLSELWKMNLSDTGYKLRKHIAKALQARSKAVRTALEAYNQAAGALDPPRPELSWEVVVEYAFLSEFNLLRFSRRDIRAEPWAMPAGRSVMDQHFTLDCAKEDIKRLDVEIPHLITKMRDEEAFIKHHEERLKKDGKPELAYQVQLHAWETARFDTVHHLRLLKLTKDKRCTASLTPGVAVSDERRVPPSENPQQDEDVPMPDAATLPDADREGEEGEAREEDDENDEDDEGVDGEAIADSVDGIWRITADFSGLNIG